jgi:hypothetical protein
MQDFFSMFQKIHDLFLGRRQKLAHFHPCALQELQSCLSLSQAGRGFLSFRLTGWSCADLSLGKASPQELSAIFFIFFSIKMLDKTLTEMKCSAILLQLNSL